MDRGMKADGSGMEDGWKADGWRMEGGWRVDAGWMTSGWRADGGWWHRVLDVAIVLVPKFRGQCGGEALAQQHPAPAGKGQYFFHQFVVHRVVLQPFTASSVSTTVRNIIPMTASRSVVQGSSSSAARRVIVAAAPTIIREAAPRSAALTSSSSLSAFAFQRHFR